MQVKCRNGHYYDDSLSQCPYCMSSGAVDIPSGLGNIKRELGKGKTELADIPGIKKRSEENVEAVHQEIEKQEPPIREKPSVQEEETSSQTVLYMPNKKKEQIEEEKYNQPIDRKEDAASSMGAVNLAGWLVVISNTHKGRSYNITFGFNTLGRAEGNHIVLEFDNSISREKHASIIYDYTNNRFFIKHEDGKYLTYLNGEVILETKELKSFDTITIGSTKLLFVPLCGENFKWDV